MVAVALLCAIAVRRLTDLQLPGTERFARAGLLGWDADWYRRIAEHGYTGVPPSGLRFFPLYPAIARILGLGTGIGVRIALLVVANAGALALGALVHRLARQEGSPATARRAAALVAVSPPAFVLVMGYTEAIALSALVGGLIALRRRAWWWAAAAGLVAGLCRPTGILLALPALIEAARGLRATGLSERLARAAAVAAAPVGAGVFLLYVQWRFGDWTLPYRVQSIAGLRGGFVDPFSRVGRALGRLARGQVGTDGHELWVPFLVAACWPMVRRWPASLAALGVATVAVALAAERLGSLERYAWGSIVLVMTVASLPRSDRGWKLLIAGSTVLLGVYATLAFLGYYVP